MAASHAAFAHHGVPGHIAGMGGWFASFCWYVFSCFLVELVTSRSTGSVLQQAFQSCVCMAVCWQPGKGKQPEDEVCQQRSAAASHAAFAHHGVPGYIAGGGYGKWRPADGSAGGAASDWSVFVVRCASSTAATAMARAMCPANGSVGGAASEWSDGCWAVSSLKYSNSSDGYAINQYPFLFNVRRRCSQRVERRLPDCSQPQLRRQQ